MESDAAEWPRVARKNVIKHHFKNGFELSMIKCVTHQIQFRLNVFSVSDETPKCAGLVLIHITSKWFSCLCGLKLEQVSELLLKNKIYLKGQLV